MLSVAVLREIAHTFCALPSTAPGNDLHITLQTKQKTATFLDGIPHFEQIKLHLISSRFRFPTQQITTQHNGHTK